ncbi:uncharacterized protein LOC110847608 isoform X2 [Folsomia candida]|uniref:uncharacterized protein LOC110847608 isoform X2 n=1 Tax=Folsomia candida TaxID=158441 RepID=UPI0016053ABE|nr:uncharacterized protein LOC110847608 isoform X2 [Folsomia candida]
MQITGFQNLLLITVSIVSVTTAHDDDNSVRLEDAIEMEFIETSIQAWHFHTYFFEVNNRSVNEMLTMRKDLRANIDNGHLKQCSLNQIFVGWDGPHPVSQFEMCCNKHMHGLPRIMGA